MGDVLFSSDDHSREEFRFRPIGREHVRQGQDVVLQRFHGLGQQQVVTAFAHADRVDHEGKALCPQYLGQGLDQRGGKEHARLGCGHGQIFQHGGQLADDKGFVQGCDAPHAHGVLSRDGRDHGSPVAAEHGDGL